MFLFPVKPFYRQGVPIDGSKAFRAATKKKETGDDLEKNELTMSRSR